MSKIFLSKEELSELSSLHFRCISPAYNFITLSASNPQDKYNEFMSKIKSKYGIDYDYEISKEGEVVRQEIAPPTESYIPDSPDNGWITIKVG